MANEIQKAPTQQNKLGFVGFMTSNAITNKVNQIIGDEKSGKRFISSIISAVNTNPLLKECDNASILSGALLGESLNLSPSPQLGMYYLVPFNDKERGKVATFQLGYKGYIQLAIRSGQYKKLNVIAIKDGELIKYDPLEEEIKVNLIEDEEEREKADTIGYYAMFEYVNGFKKSMYWSKEKMEAHALKYSQGYRADKQKKTAYTFWSKDFDGMAYKTLLRQLISKWGIMSVDMQQAYESDMAYIKDDGSKVYVDNQEDENPMIIDAKEETKEIKSLDDIE
jgi:recombination protein RecT